MYSVASMIYFIEKVVLYHESQICTVSPMYFISTVLRCFRVSHVLLVLFVFKSTNLAVSYWHSLL